MHAQGIFVTGTDTDVGKTHTAVALLRALVRAGHRAVGMKPVASGFAAGARLNEDVLLLERAGNVATAPEDRNPYAFAQPIAPHIAASLAGVTIELAAIVAAYERLAVHADALVVEGAGGALVPIDARHDMLDIAAALRLPVLLVVGMRLGCLNHALLTALAIRRRGLELRGWVANHPSRKMAYVRENIAALTERLGSAPIADIPPDEAPDIGADALARLGFTPGLVHERANI